MLAITALLSWTAGAPPSRAAGHDQGSIDGPIAPSAALDDFRLLDRWIRTQMQHRGLPGMSIAVTTGDGVIWRRGYGYADLEEKTRADENTVYRIGSITKLFTATAAMQLRDRGLLRLDDPVRRHLPWFQVESDFEDEPEITVRHLLTHTSGLPREGAFPYWTTHDFPSREELRERLPMQKAVYPPGTRYKYSNLGMALLGEVVAAASGQPYAQYVQENIFRPLGMTRATVEPHAGHHRQMATAYFRDEGRGERRVFEYYDTGAIAPAANIVASAIDLSRFVMLQLHDGTNPAYHEVLRLSTLREMHRPQVFRSSTDDGWRGAMGLGFRISRRDGKTIVSHGGWVGGNRSHLLVVPEDEIGIVVLTNADDASPSFFARAVLDTVGPALVEAKAQRAKRRAAEAAGEDEPADPAVTGAPGWWQGYTGTYTDPWGWETEVVLIDEVLALYDHDYPPADSPADGLTRLEPITGPEAEPHTFRLPDGETVRFQVDDRGRVERLWKRYEYLLPVPDPRVYKPVIPTGRDEG